MLLHAVLLAIVCSFGPTAFAHSIHIFAYAEGTTIHGEVYFRGGIPAQQASVSILDSQDKPLGKTKTDSKGKFAFEAQFHCDHNLLVTTSDGHGAAYLLDAEELPDRLPPRAMQQATAPSKTATEASATSVTQSPKKREAEETSTKESPTILAPERKEALLQKTESIHRQIVSLRKEIDDLKQETRYRDILGALGYLFGLMGLAFYFLGVNKKNSKHCPKAKPQAKGHLP